MRNRHVDLAQYEVEAEVANKPIRQHEEPRNNRRAKDNGHYRNRLQSLPETPDTSQMPSRHQSHSNTCWASRARLFSNRSSLIDAKIKQRASECQKKCKGLRAGERRGHPHKEKHTSRQVTTLLLVRKLNTNTLLEYSSEHSTHISSHTSPPVNIILTTLIGSLTLTLHSLTLTLSFLLSHSHSLTLTLSASQVMAQRLSWLVHSCRQSGSRWK